MMTHSALDSAAAVSASAIKLSSSGVSAARFKKIPWLTLLHLVCIGAFAAFLCWGQCGKAPINGDDVNVVQRTMLQHSNGQYDYLIWTRMRLHVVGLLFGEYKLACGSLETANLIWLAVYVLSAFAGYGYLRKVFNPTVALTGAIFYLCYSSKYEPLTWWSAGAYTIVWCGFFGLMYTFESKLRYRTKALAVAAIVGLSMYVYEVFLVLVPLLSAILLLRRKRDVRRLTRSDWMFAALPVVVVLVHIAILATASKPIYDPSKVARGSASLMERVGTGFTSAIDATVGPSHNKMVKQASHVYRDYYQREEPVLNGILFAAVAIFALCLVLGMSACSRSAPNLVTVNETAVIGAVALFVSAFIGFVSNYCVTPSRLTGIPSIGLMLIVCAALEWIYAFARRLRGVRKSAMIALATVVSLIPLVVAVRELKAFHSLLKQAAEVDTFDLDLASKIKALHPVLRRGDEIYVRMPKAPGEAIGRWQNFWSGFNSGRAFETFWYLYDVPAGAMDFKCTRIHAFGEDVRMQEIVDKWSDRGSTNQVYPFFIDAKQNVLPITEMILTDGRGDELKRIDFSGRFAGYKGQVAPVQKIPITSLPARGF
ncbi:MAG TPA: hypothetical protein V6C89_06895 [Drouetiella sp.]|jgi:hypothetical protein